ncbi:MAG: FAD-dependent oxidoreductase [Desulfohalobiaceae bacterium]
MSQAQCQVLATYQWLEEKLESGAVTHPRCRRIGRDVLELIRDIIDSRAGAEHMDGLGRLARELAESVENEECIRLGADLSEQLESHQEEFAGHIRSRNCPTGECPMLTPAPCQMACPAGIDVPTYIALVGEGRYAEAVSIVRKDNPFPWICGLVCTHPCEFMCVRGRMDDPIAIMALKGVAAERSYASGDFADPEPAPFNGRKVCIIGAGPGGLTAAYYLALQGYGVRVLEAFPVAGGMMRVGIPDYRLPQEILSREIAMIEDLGVEIHCNTRLGRDTDADQLREEGFEAFLLAVGAHNSYELMILGEKECSGVVPAVDFLRRVNLGDPSLPGKRVAVVGGGNVAIDAARTCVRLGCREVTILYRRSHSQMPAHQEEVVEAEQEGIRFSFLTIPKQINGDEGGCVQTITCLRAELSEPDASGRQKPVPVEGSEHDIRVDAVIPAIGQEVDDTGLGAFPEVDWTKRNTVKVDTINMKTDHPGVFAVGDAVTGPATIVEAVAGGKKAAQAINRYFENMPQPLLPPTPVRRGRLDSFPMPASLKMDLRRPHMEVLKNDRRRITFQQVHLGLSEDRAQTEATRCLRCDICIRCGLCVEICRDKMGVDALHLGYLSFDNPGPSDLKITAERCILCGACATNCPTEAMRMTDVDGERILTHCGTELNRLKLEYCESCGAVLGPARYQDYLNRRIREISPALSGKHLCLDFARRRASRQHAEISPPDEG